MGWANCSAAVDTSVSVPGWRPNPGPMAITVLPSATASRSMACRMEPVCVSASGSVINSGAWAAMAGMALAAEATVTSPAPARRAAIPAMAAAPDFPRDPATTSTCPNVPLWPPRGRGPSSAPNIEGSTSDSQASW